MLAGLNEVLSVIKHLYWLLTFCQRRPESAGEYTRERLSGGEKRWLRFVKPHLEAVEVRAKERQRELHDEAVKELRTWGRGSELEGEGGAAAADASRSPVL